jgi:hypothetical protein
LTAGTEMLSAITQDNSDFRLIAKAGIPFGHKGRAASPTLGAEGLLSGGKQTIFFRALKWPC